jgi:hypothetical protein
MSLSTLHLGRKILSLLAPAVYGIHLMRLCLTVYNITGVFPFVNYRFTVKEDGLTLIPGPIVEEIATFFM